MLNNRYNTEYLQLRTRVVKNKRKRNSIQTKQQQQQKQDKWNKCLIIHYTHEQRLASYNRGIHQIWDATFKPTPIQETKLIVGNRNNRNSAEELVSKRPNMPKALAKPHT